VQRKRGVRSRLPLPSSIFWFLFGEGGEDDGEGEERRKA
jgi:hypothetical protein